MHSKLNLVLRSILEKENINMKIMHLFFITGLPILTEYDDLCREGLTNGFVRDYTVSCFKQLSDGLNNLKSKKDSFLVDIKALDVHYTSHGFKNFCLREFDMFMRLHSKLTNIAYREQQLKFAFENYCRTHEMSHFTYPNF